MVVIPGSDNAPDNPPDNGGGQYVAFAVTNAGSDGVNGLYVSTGRLWHEAPVFENGRKCLLSREPHRSQKTGQVSYGWIIGQDQTPYYAARHEGLLPPSTGWRKFHGALPLPQLQELSKEDLSHLPHGDASAAGSFQAASGNDETKTEAREAPPLSSLPHHHMGIPREQVELMDRFFQELREDRKAKDSAGEDPAAEEPQQRARGREAPTREVGLRGGSSPSAGGGTLCAQKSHAGAASDIRDGAPSRSGAGTGADRRTDLERELDREEAEERRSAGRRVLGELRQLGATRRGEPTRFEQGGGELYCWWALPSEVSAREVRVDCRSEGDGSWLKIVVRGVVIFDRRLFHKVRADDLIWSVEDNELHLTLTKRDLNKLWDQLGAVSEFQIDEAGASSPEAVPEPMSGPDRIEKFRQMVYNDDGDHKNYEDLDRQSQEIVDAMRRYRHARATGDGEGLARAEADLDEFGHLLV